MNRFSSIAIAPSVGMIPRTRIGLLGVGRVGQAFIQLVQRGSFRGRPVQLECGLVRRLALERGPLPTGFRLSDDPSDFLQGHFDAVVEVMGGVEPARTLVSNLLSRGISVVTANKSLLSACGPRLEETARQSGACLLGEAAVIAGLPFLENLRRRPLASEVREMTGILNGTSHFLLQTMRQGATLEEALLRAQTIGLTESDCSRDLDGTDAAEKLTILLHSFANAALPSAALPRVPLSRVRPHDFKTAQRLGGILKPVAWARRRGRSIEVFVGPAIVSANHPLATLVDAENGVSLETKDFGRLFYSGLGAGPELTAATLLDDLSRVADGCGCPPARPLQSLSGCRQAETSWVVDCCFFGNPPASAQVRRHLWKEGLKPTRFKFTQTALAFLCSPCGRSALDRALTNVKQNYPCHIRLTRAFGFESAFGCSGRRGHA